MDYEYAILDLDGVKLNVVKVAFDDFDVAISQPFIERFKHKYGRDYITIRFEGNGVVFSTLDRKPYDAHLFMNLKWEKRRL